ncbi:MAG: hypothetical protein N2Z23_06220 [Pyrinomonadaceae bacterium]|nr:hypothetical protein [Pyrinomonadaceae bacterium]MCX7640018.1 hypothetical protein [Pyrinomonadaceae bacterium]MDW8304190.1 hypothetical protein [Acidobacteriota bacterium]
MTIRLLIAVVLLSSFIFAQQEKGVDTQTKQIRADSDRIGSRPNDVGRSFDFGKGKTKVKERLPNPLTVVARRDVLIENIMETLDEMKLIVDEASSRKSEGLIVTQPFVFAKGSVITANELNRYAILPDLNSIWTRGRYTLTIEVQSIDGIRNYVSVIAKIEGRTESGVSSEWTTLQSSGQAEEDFLRKFAEKIGINLNNESDNQK